MITQMFMSSPKTPKPSELLTPSARAHLAATVEVEAMIALLTKRMFMTLCPNVEDQEVTLINEPHIA